MFYVQCFAVFWVKHYKFYNYLTVLHMEISQSQERQFTNRNLNGKILKQHFISKGQRNGEKWLCKSRL